MATTNRGIYAEDLAQVHVAGYGFHWKRAAPVVLGWMKARGIRSGRIVDLGCGGGQWLHRLTEAGYEAVGVDASPAMIRIARHNAPAAFLIKGSFAEVALPACEAVTALGEPLNYLDGARSMRRVFRRVHQALRPGGLFILDLREPTTAPVPPRFATRVGEHWACIARVTESPRQRTIEREITTFRRIGNSYRRRDEVHRLRVYPKPDTLRLLRSIGFTVRAYRGYGDYRFPARQSAYVARKPSTPRAAKKK